MQRQKKGENSKAEAARARRSATEADRKERMARENEEQYWREAEGPKSRAAKKREEKAEKRAEIAAKKAEARRLAEVEERELAKSIKKSVRISTPVPKVTEAELLRRKEEEQAAMQRRTEEEIRKKARIADEKEYERIVSVANLNRDDSVIDARTLEDAIAQMTVADRNPEKSRKALFLAFSEAKLRSLKTEKPGLKQNQYKDMVGKLWKRSPDNPENQVKSTSKLAARKGVDSCDFSGKADSEESDENGVGSSDCLDDKGGACRDIH